MMILFSTLLFAISIGMVAIVVAGKLRHLAVVADANHSVASPGRYRPMLRLLSEEDAAFVSSNKTLAKTLRARRIRIFRGYLRCLTKDYGRLLAQLRLAMVRSGVDRPDLARAIARNRMFFALALCRIEFRLTLHALGFGPVDVSGLVEAIEMLREQVQTFAFAPAAIPAR